MLMLFLTELKNRKEKKTKTEPYFSSLKRCLIIERKTKHFIDTTMKMRPNSKNNPVIV